jgi:hypothetical protein
MDFVEPLPRSRGYDSIFVIVDRLTKWAVFIPAKTTWKSQDMAQAFVDHVVAQHGLPEAIVSDRGNKFVSIFWTALMKRLNVDLRLSTAYQPQTDGQTERVNQTLEHYLRVHCEHRQNDWADLLGLASFAYNNTLHTTTKHTPFYANYGYHPRWAQEFSQEGPISKKDRSMATDLAEIHAECVENIAEANQYAARFYNEGRQEPPKFEVGDKVRLSMKDIKSKRPARKLDWKYTGPYRVLEKVGSHAYRLELPSTAKIHDVFHVSRLEPWRASTIGEDEVPPPPLEVDGEEEYEVQAIVGERTSGRGGSKHKEYLVQWKGYEGTLDETSWVHEDQVQETSALDDYLAEKRLL